MKTSLLSLIGLTMLTGVAVAAPQTFDFKDPKGVNNAVFKLDAPLETIQGSANGISGSVAFDPQAPASTKGKLVVNTASLHVTNPTMKEHMHGAQWMDISKFRRSLSRRRS